MQKTELEINVRWMKLSGESNPIMNRKFGKAFINYMPELGHRLDLNGRDGDVGISTSPVKRMEVLLEGHKQTGLLIHTMNSIYFVEFID